MITQSRLSSLTPQICKFITVGLPYLPHSNPLFRSTDIMDLRNRYSGNSIYAATATNSQARTSESQLSKQEISSYGREAPIKVGKFGVVSALPPPPPPDKGRRSERETIWR